MKCFQKLKSILGLSFQLAKAGFKLRNEGTWIGVFWYLLSPLLTFIILLGIFRNNLGGNTPFYPIYLLLGILMFNFFQAVTSASTNIIRQNSGLIKSINFPKESLIFSTLLMFLFSHFFEIIILIAFILFFKIPVLTIVFYPFVLFFLCSFIFGISLILASLTVYIHDLENVWNFTSKIIWFATPIFYTLEENSKLYYLNFLNPMYYYITIARDLIIYSKMPEIWVILVAITYSLFFVFVGIVIFNKLKNKFAELI